MDFAFSDEQEELRRTVRAFLTDTSPETEVRRLMETPGGLRPGAVAPDGDGARACRGWRSRRSTAVPGAGRSKWAWCMEEMGRALLCAPFLSSAVLATTTLLRCADEEARKRLLPGAGLR